MEAKNCSTDGKMKLHIRLLQTSLSEILIISAMIRVNILIETYWKGKGMYADTGGFGYKRRKLFYETCLPEANYR